jgi:hypothetical protein
MGAANTGGFIRYDFILIQALLHASSGKTLIHKTAKRLKSTSQFHFDKKIYEDTPLQTLQFMNVSRLRHLNYSPNLRLIYFFENLDDGQ